MPNIKKCQGVITTHTGENNEELKQKREAFFRDYFNSLGFVTSVNFSYPTGKGKTQGEFCQICEVEYDLDLVKVPGFNENSLIQIPYEALRKEILEKAKSREDVKDFYRPILENMGLNIEQADLSQGELFLGLENYIRQLTENYVDEREKGKKLKRDVGRLIAINKGRKRKVKQLEGLLDESEEMDSRKTIKEHILNYLTLFSKFRLDEYNAVLERIDDIEELKTVPAARYDEIRKEEHTKYKTDAKNINALKQRVGQLEKQSSSTEFITGAKNLIKILQEELLSPYEARKAEWIESEKAKITAKKPAIPIIIIKSNATRVYIPSHSALEKMLDGAATWTRDKETRTSYIDIESENILAFIKQVKDKNQKYSGAGIEFEPVVFITNHKDALKEEQKKSNYPVSRDISEVLMKILKGKKRILCSEVLDEFRELGYDTNSPKFKWQYKRARNRLGNQLTTKGRKKGAVYYYHEYVEDQAHQKSRTKDYSRSELANIIVDYLKDKDEVPCTELMQHFRELGFDVKSERFKKQYSHAKSFLRENLVTKGTNANTTYTYSSKRDADERVRLREEYQEACFFEEFRRCIIETAKKKGQIPSKKQLIETLRKRGFDTSKEITLGPLYYEQLEDLNRELNQSSIF